MRVLIIEDDPAISGQPQRGLQEEHHVVSSAPDGRTGFELAKSSEFDVIVLDWMLPGIDGLDVMRRLRKTGNASPILMLTARHSVLDIVKALDVGADDCLKKPFSFPNFLARLKALARRQNGTPRPNRLEIADLVL